LVQNLVQKTFQILEANKFFLAANFGNFFLVAKFVAKIRAKNPPNFRTKKIFFVQIW
jgi:hypothetical protein